MRAISSAGRFAPGAEMLIVNKILVSACLVGRAVRYDGRAAAIDHPIIRQWQSEGRLVVVCPEVLGGLPVPRPPAQIREGTAQDVLEGKALVVNAKGEDVSPQYLGGAAAGLAAVQKHRIRVAVLKTQSPSCGPQETNHRGSGEGVMAALLRLNGVAVFGEYDIELAAKAFAGLDLEPPELPRC